MFMVLSSLLRPCASSPGSCDNAEQRHMAANLLTKPTNLSHKPICRQLGKLHPSVFPVNENENRR